jgi:hypothetical protein
MKTFGLPAGMVGEHGAHRMAATARHRPPPPATAGGAPDPILVRADSACRQARTAAAIRSASAALFIGIGGSARRPRAIAGIPTMRGSAPTTCWQKAQELLRR